MILLLCENENENESENYSMILISDKPSKEKIPKIAASIGPKKGRDGKLSPKISEN